MYKVILIEVIAPGKRGADKAYRETSQKLFDRHGAPHKVWSVEGRKMGQVLVEFGPYDSREEADAIAAKIYADEAWPRLQAERTEAGVVVPGTQEIYILTD